MKHATSRAMFDYWDALRGERAAPERRAIQPVAMRHILADTFLLEIAPPEGPAFRLAGTRVGALFCRDLAGTPFDRLWPDGCRADAHRAVELVTGETVGALLGLLGRNENGSELPLELLLLPLRHRGRTDRRLIGTLSPGSIPSWAGLVPLAGLEVRSTRIIEPAREAESRPSGASVGRRSVLVVHEGGLAP